ncbi:glycosyltransferase family 39 protein [Candidatus Desantisbacteria bacterium]|nr:glycosyltransferase family 39 protein [Candidatus Desantisbacteria bacterium]
MESQEKLSNANGIDFNEKKIILLVFVFAVLIRFFYIYFFYGFDTLPGMDEIYYQKLAGNISDGLGFAIKKDAFSTKKPPVYPYFMTGIYFIFGRDNFFALRIIQILLGGICTILIYIIAGKLGGRRVALISSILVSIDPLLIYISAWILAHIMVYLFTLLAVFYCLNTIEKPSCYNIILAGMFWGLTGLSMGYNTFLFYPYIFIWGLIIFRTDKKEALKISVILFLSMTLTVSIWTIRNYTIYKKFIPIVTSGGHRFKGSNNARADGMWTPSSGSPRFFSTSRNRGWGDSPDWESWACDADSLWLDLLFSEKKDYNDYEVNLLNYRAGWKWIKNNPVSWLKLLPKKFYHLWEPLNPRSTFPRLTQKRRRAVIIFYCFIFPLFVIGIYLSKAFWRKYLIIYLAIIHTIIGSMIYYGDAQQRVIITPFLSIFAAFTLSRIIKFRKNDE